MESVMDVANYLCNEYEKISGEKLDEMKLHKLLYFIQRENIVVKGEPMFSEEFEGWEYGPVCPDVRERFYQGEIIGNAKEISWESVCIVNDVLSRYGDLESWKLSEMTHKESSWINARTGLMSDEYGCVTLKFSDIKKDAENIPKAEYENIKENIYILGNKTNYEHILKSLDELKSGKTIVKTIKELEEMADE